MQSREGFTGAKQKTSRQSSLTQPASVTSPVGQKSNQPDEYVPIFYQEISDIMRGFGDCETPLKESVHLVDKILLQQLRGILHEVTDLAIERKGKPEPTQKDFELLMCTNPVKVFRLQKHIKDLQLRRKIQEIYDGRSSAHSDELDTNGPQSDDEVDRDVAERYDEEKIRRLFRADRISQTLNGTQYIEYNEARRSSIYCRNSNTIRTKLRTWLKAPTDGVFSNQVYTILSYLAHETIAAVVDFAILSRLNSSNRPTEPFRRITSSSKCFFSPYNKSMNINRVFL